MSTNVYQLIISEHNALTKNLNKNACFLKETDLMATRQLIKYNPQQYKKKNNSVSNRIVQILDINENNTTDRKN
jgi:hypothetical protein